MKLHAPSMAMFWVSLILAVLALIGAVVTIRGLTHYGVWLALIGYVVLAVGTVAKI